MIYPLVSEFAADGVPVTVTCRVVRLAHQPHYRWLASPVTRRDWVQAYRMNALVETDAHVRLRPGVVDSVGLDPRQD